MVGPRSSGCRTCVQRRVRCDRARPRCTRCQKAGIQCAGFTPPIVFMPPLTTRKASDNRSEVSLSKSVDLSVEKALTEASDLEIVISREGTLSFNMPGLVPAPTLGTTPSSYTDDSYCVFFLDRYFCLDNWNDDLQSNKAWLWRSLQAPSQYPISNLATRALTAAFFAKAHNTKRLDQYSYHLHGLALRAMASEMQQENLSFDILSANALLGLYEACSYTSQLGWQRHARAMRMLFQKIGPDFFKHRPARSLLMLCRFNMISEAIISREKCFLADDAWQNILVSDDREASLTLKLGDIVIPAPGIFGEIKEIESSLGQDDDAMKAQKLFVKLFDHLSDLKRWWSQWSSDIRRMPTRTAVLNRSEDFMVPPPTSPGMTYRFCNLEAAAGWCRYHAHVLLALRWMRRLLSLQLPQTIPLEMHHENDGLFLTEDNINYQVSEHEIQSHALAVCDGLHFYSLPRYRHVGAVYMGLPARVAWQSLLSESPGSLWIEQLLEFMTTHSGFSIPRHTLHNIAVND